MTRLPESTARRYGKVFDEIAAEYDRRRPAYPDELIDQACRVAGIRSGDRVLEVGCGSGQLTRSLAGRGLRVTALEPGTNLISLARHNLAGHAEVEFVTAQFEDAPLLRERLCGGHQRGASHRPSRRPLFHQLRHPTHTHHVYAPAQTGRGQYDDH